MIDNMILTTVARHYSWLCYRRLH